MSDFVTAIELTALRSLPSVVPWRLPPETGYSGVHPVWHDHGYRRRYGQGFAVEHRYRVLDRRHALPLIGGWQLCWPEPVADHSGSGFTAGHVPGIVASWRCYII